MAADLPKITAQYHFHRAWTESKDGQASHQQVLRLLAEAKRSGLLFDYETYQREDPLPKSDADLAVLNSCREFAMRRAIRVRLGSNRSKYGWFPSQLLIVRNAKGIRDAFPCQIESKLVQPADFLESFLRREAWTIVSSHQRTGGRTHKILVDALVANPASLEAGLTYRARDVRTSDGSGEVGYIDLLFVDRLGRYLLVEVKVKAAELDKAHGQIIRHRALFLEENCLTSETVRIAIACPDFPGQRRRLCESSGIECFVLV